MKEQTHSNPAKEELSISAETVSEEVMNQEESITVEDYAQNLPEDSTEEENNSTSTTEEEQEIPFDEPVADSSQVDAKEEKEFVVLADANKPPKTGDTSNLFSNLGGLFLSTVGVLGVFWKRCHRNIMCED